MRIGMILSTPLPPGEGIGHYVWNLAWQLIGKGHAVQLITRGGAHPPVRAIRSGIIVWHLPFIPLYPFHVHIHNVFIQRLLRALESDLDLLHLHSPLVRLPLTRLPTIVTVHSPTKFGIAALPANTWLGRLARLQAPFSFQLERELFQRADRIVSTSAGVANELSAYGIDPKTVGLLGNGVDTAIFKPDFNARPNEPSYFLTAGRLSPGKGLEDLLQCAAIVTQSKPEVKFFIAGGGPMAGALKDQIQRLGISQSAILLGRIDQSQRMAELYQKATAYIHPSHYEGLPTVILEAMACARPVIATAISGTRDVIAHGINGLLVPPKNPQQMADAILNLLNDPDRGAALGAAAHQTILERYTWDMVSDRYLAEYQTLLAGAHS